MAVRPHVVIVGSGFGGLNAAKSLAGKAVDVTVIDRDNYHGFWPLLYQVATAGLGGDDIARPIRAVYAGHPNIRVRIGSVTGVDLEQRRVCVDDRDQIGYDFLIMAAGSATTDFGIPGVAEHAFPLKTLPDAVRLRNHILTAFERADARHGSVDADTTIVLVGGGPTGVEMAGALSELIGHNLASDFPTLDLTRARVVLVEMTDHLLPGFGRASQDRARHTLEARGVEVRFSTKLQKVTDRGVSFEDGSEIEAATVVWTAGVAANPLAGLFPGEKGKGQTVPVQDDLSVAGHPEVFVIGDLAAATGKDGSQLPQLAQVAIQGGRAAAGNVLLQMAGRPTRKFTYRNHGIMATIGRRQAVAELPGGISFGGTLGWLSWLGVHLLFLVGFRNRIVVLTNWAWNYLTWDRASRVILDDGSITPTGQHRA
ncbi:MAG TPA: NAD(P)/FAD-dependent oxidoreductase [Acidimicrobiales bacterium]|jgi:NADH dehydrogenase|nr:NAD(P)/FAD-dependent oxidoreductase [Acidimicrobiales bacterium]